MKKLVLEFIFDEVEEDDYSELELRALRLGEGSTLSPGERRGVTEMWGQSDQWHVDIHNDILNVLDSGIEEVYD